LSQHILRLAQRYGTPPFEPHVTLAGGLWGPLDKVRSLTRELASSLHPFPVLTGLPAGEDVFFRALYLTVRRSRPLMRANRLAADLFSLPRLPYRPHVSLLYGDLSARRKAAIIEQLQSVDFPSFETRSLHVVDTARPVLEWRELGEFPLAAGR
jgi:2'-5' RNA ligase